MRTAKFVTLDDYIFFLENPEEHDLTIDHLNQILQIHGFHKKHKQPKKVIRDAIRSLPMLITPFRSSIKENSNNFSTAALLTKNEVVKDLSDLQWHEYCPLQSIETLIPPSNNSSSLNGDRGEEKEEENHLRRRRKSDIGCLKPKKVLVSMEMRDAKWGAKRKRNSSNRRRRRSCLTSTTPPTPLFPCPPLPPTAAAAYVPLGSWLSL